MTIHFFKNNTPFSLSYFFIIGVFFYFYRIIDLFKEKLIEKSIGNVTY
ncbi:hypothetical protein B4129_2592 [Bacillus safensis]|nr:hypothetical protein B4129_2592 [Bacillus safensis]